MSQMDFGTIKMFLNVNLKPIIYMFTGTKKNCVFLKSIDMLDFMSELALHLDQTKDKKFHFAKIAWIKKLEKSVFASHWWIKIVSMDPKSNLKLLGDHFEIFEILFW